MKLLSDWGATIDGSCLTLAPPSRQSFERLLLEGFPVDLRPYDQINVQLGDRTTDITYFAKRCSGAALTYTPTKEIGDMPYALSLETQSLPLLKTMTMMLESGKPSGVVDVATGYQQAISDDCIAERSGLFFQGITASGALQIRRQDLWLPQDLQAFEAEWPKILEPNNPDSIMEWTWRGKMPGGEAWKKFTTRYRLIQEPDGRLLHCAIALGWDDISAPTP